MFTPLKPRERTVRAAFAEINLPVFAGTNERTGFGRLDLSLSSRFENYSDAGESTVPKFGFRWSPTEELVFRGSIGRSFKAPLLLDLGRLSSAVYVPIPAQFDPIATGDSTLTLLLLGGTPDLKPEKADTWTLGLQFAPPNAGFPRLDVGYFHVKLKDRVSFPSATLFPIFLTPELFPGVLIRNPTDAQIADALASIDDREGVPSPTPPVEAMINFRLQNIAAAELDGIDLSAGHRIPTRFGEIDMSVVGSYLLRFDERFSAAAPETSVASTMGRPVDLKVRGGVSWTRGRWSTSAFANYVDEYRDTLSTPNRGVGSWTTVDVQLSYYADDLLGSAPPNSVTVSLSATNVLDKNPPFANWPTGFGFDAANADPIGRRISLELALNW